MTRGLLILATLLAMALAGCGDEDDSTSTGGGPVSTPSPEPPPDDGCPDTHRNRIFNRGTLAEQFRSCVSEDATSLHLENVSSFVLMVRDDRSGAVLRVSEASPDPTTFADAMVQWVAEPSCAYRDGSCQMPPGSTIVADGAAPPRVVVWLNESLTAQATAAEMFGGFVAAKIAVPGEARARQVQACASLVSSLMASHAYVEDAIRSALAPGTTCAALYRSVTAEAAEQVPPNRATSILARYGKQMGANLTQDLTVLGATRIVSLLNPRG